MVTADHVESLILLMVRHRLTHLKAGEVELILPIHQDAQAAAKAPEPNKLVDMGDGIMVDPDLFAAVQS